VASDTWVVIIGTLPGVFIGAMVRVTYLPDPKHFKLFAAGILLYIGLKMVRDMLKNKDGGDNKKNSEKRFQELMRSYRSRSSSTAIARATHLKATTVTHFNLKRLGYTFYDESFDVSFWGIFILSFIVGIAGMYPGACCQKFVPAKAIKWMLAVIIISTACKYIVDFFNH
jgi:uncharacterized membrane protein YfcA